MAASRRVSSICSIDFGKEAFREGFVLLSLSLENKLSEMFLSEKFIIVIRMLISIVS